MAHMRQEFEFSTRLDVSVANRVKEVFLKKFFKSSLKKKKIWNSINKSLIDSDLLIFPKKLPLAIFDGDGVNTSFSELIKILRKNKYYVMRYVDTTSGDGGVVYFVESQELKARLQEGRGMLNSDYSYVVDPQFQWFFEFREFNPDKENFGVLFGSVAVRPR